MPTLKRKDPTHHQPHLVEISTRVCLLQMQMVVTQVSLEMQMHKMEIGNKEIPSHTIPTRIGETIPKAGREVDGRIPSKITITLVSLVTRVVRVKVTTNGSLAVATLLEAEAATTHRVHGIRHHQHLMPIMAKVKAPITHLTTKVASLVMVVKVHKVRVRVRMAKVQRYPSPRINREAVTQGKLGYPRSRGT